MTRTYHENRITFYLDKLEEAIKFKNYPEAMYYDIMAKFHRNALAYYNE